MTSPISTEETSTNKNWLRFEKVLNCSSIPANGTKQTELITTTRRDAPKDETSINSQYLIRAGFIDRLMAGVYSFLPMGMRVLTKIEDIIREEMNALGSAEILMPALHPREIWDKTGRWDKVDVLFKFKGAGDRDLTLGPTHEEVVTPLIGQYINSYRKLPTSVYQIQGKFRNEVRAKAGLLRGREFRMKDMYSFHASQEDLDAYYERAIEAYKKIFMRCGLGTTTFVTYASGGIFSQYSHEFQTITEYGEDEIFLCENCGIAVNREIIEDQKNACPKCHQANLISKKAIEVGNIFKLGDRFSSAFKLSFKNEKGNEEKVVMGCYGLGSTRLLGAVVEICHDKKGIIWPEEIAPYQVHLISLGDDTAKADELFEMLKKRGVSTLYDNRPQVNPGEKFADSDLIGIPWRIVVSKRTLANDSFELKARNSEVAETIPLNVFNNS